LSIPGMYRYDSGLKEDFENILLTILSITNKTRFDRSFASAPKQTDLA